MPNPLGLAVIGQTKQTMGFCKNKGFNFTASKLRVNGHESFGLFDLLFRERKKLNRFFYTCNPSQPQLFHPHQFPIDRRGSIDF